MLDMLTQSRSPADAQAEGVPPVAELRQFLPLAGLDRERLALVRDLLRPGWAEAGALLFELGSRDPLSFFLLAGAVELTPAEGEPLRVEGGGEAAAAPLAELRPRRYRGRALTVVRYLTIDTAVLRALAQPDGPAYRGPDEEGAQAAEAAERLCERIRQDLDQDRLALPSLPDVALRVGEAIRDAHSDAGRIASVIQMDPAIAAKVVKVANAALYGGRARITSCRDAVVRLGLEATGNLVTGFALREVFRAHGPHAQRRMRALWRHSVRVAAICYVLAAVTRRFGPERVLLAGLVHDIGAVPLLTYADELLRLAGEGAEMDAIVARLRAPVAARVLGAWGFGADMVEAAVHAEDWMYDPGGEARYADLVIVAQLHAFIGHRQERDLPGMEGLPAFRRLFPDGLSPRDSLKLLRRAADKLAQIEAPLRGP